MDKFQCLQGTWPLLLPVIIVLAIWEAFWKLMGMWRAGRNDHLAWFICIALINTAGILPIIYILTHKKKPGTGMPVTGSDLPGQG